ncbi:MAG: nucleotide sugar dehydrogenase [Planctomycetes bacterium]|nr:nucleotide sugar dehydrogenase [Planctomycetota bacterium]
MRVSVFGLGYVGAVSCGCFAHDGLEVIGVDLNTDKVKMINDGRSPIIEEKIGEIIADAVAGGTLRATTDAEEAVLNTDVSIVSVGTPSKANGSADLAAVERVSEQIGRAIAAKTARHVIVIRSTVMPGTVRGLVVPALEAASGKKFGEDFGVCFNPEFLREGSSVRDHYNPPFTLIGQGSDNDGDAAAQLYAKVDAELIRATIEEAELVKYVCNAFHALKVTFANEVGILARAMDVNSHHVMDIVCKDTKLNISTRYLKPGFAFGGSCLPKDVKALVHKAREKDLDLPLLRSVIPSNRMQIDRAVDEVLKLGRKRLGILGLSFKAGTDDLRESPIVSVTETLIGKGFDIKIYDKNISLARLVGANRDYIEKEIPHISSLMAEELSEVVDHAEVLLIGNSSPEFAGLAAFCKNGQTVIDLAHIDELARADGINYVGITW